MMGKEDESEDQTLEQSLEEASGFTIQDDKTDFCETKCEFLKCAPSYVQVIPSEDDCSDEKPLEENGHQVLKRIIRNNIEPSEYCNEASGVICENNCDVDSSDYELLDSDNGNHLLVFEDSDGTWRLRWHITDPENEDDFIALCWAGGWYEETVKYIHEKHKHGSTYLTDFTPQSQIAEHKNDVWNNSIAGEGIERGVLMDHEGKLYYENHSTTTDLDYNWLPKCKKPHRKYSMMHNSYVPEQDLSFNYGNITNYGLKEKKRIQWAYENLTGSSSYSTETRESYVKYDPSLYNRETKGTRREISAKMYPVNINWANLWTRNRPISLVPDFPLRVLKRPYPHFYY